MNNYKKPFLIAEIGCNHMGQLEIAKDLINLAKMSGASVAKFRREIILSYYQRSNTTHHTLILTILWKNIWRA